MLRSSEVFGRRYEGEQCEKPKYTVKQVVLHSSQCAPHCIVLLNLPFAGIALHEDTQRKGLCAAFPHRLKRSWCQLPESKRTSHAATCRHIADDAHCRALRLRNFHEVEVREYEPFLVAETTIKGKPMRKAMGTGFMNVARCASPCDRRCLQTLFWLSGGLESDVQGLPVAASSCLTRTIWRTDARSTRAAMVLWPRCIKGRIASGQPLHWQLNAALHADMVAFAQVHLWRQHQGGQRAGERESSHDEPCADGDAGQREDRDDEPSAYANARRRRKGDLTGGRGRREDLGSRYAHADGDRGYLQRSRSFWRRPPCCGAVQVRPAAPPCILLSARARATSRMH